ncbi:MAG TPA: apolipoprotein N-acyltransferase, partial [Pseudomonas sp.]|nr:apolipoprotein N-acyltransferase [Pseudomonas sp.]
MRWITRPGWPGHLLALAAGALTPLAFSPFDLWPLLLLSIALFYLGLRQVSGRAAVARGWCYGLGVFAAGTSWVFVSIHDYGAAPVPLALLLTVAFVAGLGLLFALLGWLWARWLRTGTPLLDALAFAALWVALEAFRGWFLTGFPWLYAGYSQLYGPLASLAPLGGVWLLSFLVALSATLIVELARVRDSKLLLGTARLLLFAPWLAGLLLAGYQWTSPKGEPLRVAAVQGNVPQLLKWEPQQLNAQLALYRDLTLAAPPADLIVWPETAVPVLRQHAETYLTAMGEHARERGAALITGLPIRQPNAAGELRYYNGLTSLGEGSGTYLKQ